MELVVLGFNDFTTTVVAIGGYVVTQMSLTGSGLYCNCRRGQKVKKTKNKKFKKKVK